VKFKCILFDCIETVIDIFEKADSRVLAWWAYNGCGYECLWDNFDSFAEAYEIAINELAQFKEIHEEYNIFERFRFMVKQKTNDKNELGKVATAVFQNYWSNYKANCYVDDSVRNTLSYLCSRFKCGIVSNFMVEGGVEELLEIHDIGKYFDFVVTSIGVGWRKPDARIYDVAVELAKVPNEQILFVGNDYKCDFKGPIQYGLEAIWLDKHNIENVEDRRIEKIKDLIYILG
jgi:putative hydrolase of the HAD superfamily